MSVKLLYIDIEWEPATAHVWRMWDENITPAQLLDAGGMLCFCAILEGDWGDTPKELFYSKWEHGRDGMAEAALSLLTRADAVLTYNGDKYDIPKLRGEILLAGLGAPPVVTSIDLIKTVKSLGFVMNRLAYIGPLLGVGGKVKHEGFTLWKDVIAGKAVAQNKMRRYCIQDVKLLVKLYRKIKPFIKSHPFIGSRGTCGACDGKVLHSRGLRRTKTFMIQRLQCQQCGSWQDGTRTKVTTPKVGAQAVPNG